MGLLVVRECLMWLLLGLCVNSIEYEQTYPRPVLQEVWLDHSMHGGGGSLAKNLLQSLILSGVLPSLAFPLQSSDFMDLRNNFAITLMNSSWSGPAETNVFKRGEPVFLQVSVTPVPGQELYLQSCYAAPSPNPSDDFRYALIHNKGCVASKQSVIQYVSRQTDSINLLLNTANLKLPQFYLHCSAALSQPVVTQDTKSCNFDQNSGSWTELSGQADVCSCCATKCRGPPFIGASFSGSKAIITVGPVSIKEREYELNQLPSLKPLTTSEIGASVVSTGEHWLTSGASSKGSVMGSSSGFLRPADVTVSLIHDLEKPSPWESQFGPVQSVPVLEMGLFLPNRRSIANIVGLSSQRVPLVDQPLPDAPLEAIPDLTHQMQNSDVFMADAPVVAENFEAVPAFQHLKQPEMDLRGDVFMNYKWSGMDVPWETAQLQGEQLVAPLQNNELSGAIKTEDVTETKSLDLDTGYVKHSKITFTQTSDGSRSLSYEENTTGLSDKMDKNTPLGVVKEKETGSLTKLEVKSLLDMLRGLSKLVTGQ